MTNETTEARSYLWVQLAATGLAMICAVTANSLAGPFNNYWIGVGATIGQMPWGALLLRRWLEGKPL